MKPSIRDALVFGTLYGILMGLFFGVSIGLLMGISRGVVTGVAGAVTTGIVFGIFMARARAASVAIQRRESQECPEIIREGLLYDGPANHFLNLESVGGWLYLTEKGLFFRSHKLNLRPHELSVPLPEISEVQAVRTAKIFQNGLLLTTTSGTVERFVVEENKKWCAEIAKAQAQDLTPG
jgi:hypothetical protein